MLENIGIDGKLLTFQIINFLVLVFVLNKFLYKPVLKIIKDRQSEINSGLKLKEDMEKKEEGLRKERQEILSGAREEAQEILEQKRKEADKVKEKIIAEARIEKEEIVTSGKREVEANRIEMEKKMQVDVIEIAYEMTQKVLRDILSNKDQSSIILSQLKKIATLKVSKINK